MRPALAALLVVLVAVSPGAAREPAAVLPSDLVQLGVPEGSVYRVTLSVRDGAWTEIVAPLSGHCRREDPGEHVEIAGGRTRAIVDRTTGVSIRTGSPEFVFGRLGDRCSALTPIRERLARGEATHAGTLFGFERDGIAVTARVEEEMTARGAAERRLFAVPLERLLTYDLERVVGARPSLPIRAYWFGRSFAGRRATRAIEHFDYYADQLERRRPTLVYMLFYQLPGSRLGGKPGERNPPGEIQVTSQPLDQRLARNTLAAINGVNGGMRTKPWPRRRITLANGERATLVPARWESAGRIRNGFLVITRRTLVSVVFRVRLTDIPALARRLRPISAAGD
jgi:hypothetical protein